MKHRRVVTRNKEDIHLTILVDGCPEDYEKLYQDLQRAIHIHNRGAEKKISYDINFFPTPELWKERTQESFCNPQVPLGEFLKDFAPQQK